MQLWIIGQTHKATTEKTTELVGLSGNSIPTSSPGPDLPKKFVEPCATYLNASHAIITSHPAYSYIVDLNNDFVITELPPFSHVTWLDYPACARFMHPNGTNFVVVAATGATASSVTANHVQTEIISEASLDSWTEGKNTIYLLATLPMHMIRYHVCSFP